MREVPLYCITGGGGRDRMRGGLIAIDEIRRRQGRLERAGVSQPVAGTRFITWGGHGGALHVARSFPRIHRGTSLIRNCPPIGPYSRTMPRALWRSWGGAQFLMSEVPLYRPPARGRTSRTTCCRTTRFLQPYGLPYTAHSIQESHSCSFEGSGAGLADCSQVV